MVNTRARRRMGRYAAVAVIAAVAVGGLATAAWRVGPTLWTLSAPADRLGALVADAERELTRGTTAPSAGVIAPPALVDSSRPARADPSTRRRGRRRGARASAPGRSRHRARFDVDAGSRRDGGERGAG